MTKPLIRIRYFQGRVFYWLVNGWVNDRNVQFMGAFSIEQLFTQIKQDGVVCK